MNKQITQKLVIGFVLILILSGCASLTQSRLPPTADPAAISTQVAATLFARYTIEAPLVSNTPLPTNTAPAESTPNLTSTVIPSSTPLVMPETNTPLPSITPAPTGSGSGGGVSTSTPIGGAQPTTVCNRAEFVSDISVPDGSVFAPGAVFVKTWRLKNVGTCTWDEDYDLVFVSGNDLDAKKRNPLPDDVSPGEVVDLSVEMRAPGEDGTYTSNWMLSSPSGVEFGVGSNGSQSFDVSIRVAAASDTDLVYDFALNFCQAEWETNNGSLPCPGSSTSTDGFVILLDEPALENRHENEWAIWTHPPVSQDAFIRGIYPEIELGNNQRFIAWIGCLDDSTGCRLNFYLDFEDLNTGDVTRLGSWSEIYDGSITQIDLDLSSHAGKSASFILSVEVDGGTPANANGFWFVPGIIQD